ncbi:MAG TPA: hypothetical protein DCP92_20025 [Nitrospiraceae bacterium]|nr:hypothetical protein [Nitrospiraceae bacterium]
MFFALLCLAFFSGCATTHYTYVEALYTQNVTNGTVLQNFSLDPLIEDQILALDPEHISEKDIKEVLSHAPAPRIINIHGGIFPVYLAMKSFSKFLIGMGYPETKIRNPKNGDYSYSCYDSSEMIAGSIAWYYEKEGMRPMMVGHSQGGMQAVKVLHDLAGTFGKDIPVWNPLTGQSEKRYSIIDPLTGCELPVTGVQLSYATAVGAGGLTRLLPNQWSMLGKLRSIPDSVEEFTGFYIGLDFLGGDLLGFGPSNKYEPTGTAKVRNVRLPAGFAHTTVPATKHLAESQEIRDWINNYQPTEEPKVTVTFQSSSTNILWAADVWHSIKKQWCLEVQSLIRAKRALKHVD